MDYLMKLVTTALEWSYEAKAPNVRPETLEKAAELLVLRRDTLRIIDGDGPNSKIQQSDTTEQESRQEAETEEKPAPNLLTRHDPPLDEMGETQTEASSAQCSFSGPIQLEAARWRESRVEVVQCPTCGSVSKAKLKAQSIIIASHPKRKSRPVRNVTRWMEQAMGWELVQKKV